MGNKKQAASLGWLFTSTIILYIVLNVLGVVVKAAGINIPLGFLLVWGELTILIPGAIFILVKRLDLKEDIGYRRIKPGTIFMSILLAITTMPLLVLVNLVSQLFVENEAVQSMDYFMSCPWGWILFVTAIVAPVCEETMFRGILNNGMKALTSGFIAAITSAILFGIMHMNVNQALYAFVLGIIASIVNTASGSILTSIIMHVCINGYNTVAMLISYTVFDKGNINIAEIAEEYRETDAMYLMIAIYLVLAVIFTLVSIPIVAWIAKHEGHYEELLMLFRERKGGTRVFFTFSCILGVVMCLFVMFGLEPLLKSMGF